MQIIVGHGLEKQIFRTHKALLCHASSYFKAALEGGFVEAENQKIELAEDDPKVFERIQLWLYQDTLVEPEEHPLYFNILIDLYLFANARGMPQLQNAALDAFIDRNKVMNALPDGSIHRIYENTTQASCLRKLYVDITIRNKAITRESWDYAEDKENRFPKQYLLDLIIRLNDDRNDRKPTDFRKIRCDYHIHGKDEPRCS